MNIIIENVINNIFSIIKFWIIIHFGRNPRKGGNPPNDKKLIIKANFINGILFNEKKSCLMWNVFKFFMISIKLIEMNE